VGILSDYQEKLERRKKRVVVMCMFILLRGVSYKNKHIKGPEPAL